MEHVARVDLNAELMFIDAVQIGELLFVETTRKGDEMFSIAQCECARLSLSSGERLSRLRILHDSQYDYATLSLCHLEQINRNKINKEWKYDVLVRFSALARKARSYLKTGRSAEVKETEDPIFELLLLEWETRVLRMREETKARDGLRDFENGRRLAVGRHRKRDRGTTHGDDFDHALRKDKRK